MSFSMVASRTCLGLLLAFGCAVQSPAAQEIISHPGLADRRLTQTEAVLYFTRRLTTWSDGQPVKIFVLADEDPLHQSFVKRVLGLFPYQLRRTWDRQLFSGTGQVPVRVPDEAAMLRRVAATPGAIGYARAPGNHAGVRVQPVEGR